MSLGKRFIPVIAPDDSDGTEFTTTMYDVEAVAANVHRGYQGCHHVRTLAVDLDDLPAIDASLDEQHQHAERMATKWLARYQDLSAEVGRVPGTCEPVDERRQMRAVIEAMRPIVERAMLYVDRLQDDGFYDDFEQLGQAIFANRDRLGAAMSAWENSQTLSEDEAASAIARAAIAWVDASDGDRGTARQLVDAIRANRSALTANAGRQR